MSGTLISDTFNPTIPPEGSTASRHDPLAPQPATERSGHVSNEPAVELHDFGAAKTSLDEAEIYSDSESDTDERAQLVTQPGGAAAGTPGGSGKRAQATPDPHMNRKPRSERPQGSQPTSDAPNTQLPNENGDMNTTSPLEHRRKYNADLDRGSTSSGLLARDEFSFAENGGDESKRKDEDTQHGFFDLPQQDRRNFLLLILLYFLQGIPMGLAGGSVPFLLKSPKYGVSYGAIGVFSLASYPYSLKLLWSPIVDAVWSQRIGRRKSWILPVQVFSGLGMLWLGSQAETMMESAGAGDGSGIWGFTSWWFFLVFTCATQDIAVDGWAITILSQKHLAYASTAQTVGLTGGSFLSFTVFLALSDPHFANKWFRSAPLPNHAPSSVGIWTLGGYLTFWGWAYLLVTIGLALLKREDRTRDREGILEVYKVMLGILQLKSIQTIIIIHLIAKIGFQANDAVTNLKLLDKGFGQDNMSLAVLIDFPIEVGLGYYAGKWSSTYPPMQLWCWAFIGRLFAAAFAQIVVMIFPAGSVASGFASGAAAAAETAGVPGWYVLTVIVEHVFSTFMNTVMFVAVSAFHAKIADPVIGGTYMTLLATVSNLGGTFPRYFILKAVDSLTSATCLPSDPPKALKGDADPITSPFSCVQDAEKYRCLQGGGTCVTTSDGYYIMNVVCILVGAVTFVSYIRPRVLGLQGLSLREWRLRER